MPVVLVGLEAEGTVIPVLVLLFSIIVCIVLLSPYGSGPRSWP
jgi:hypothetical protein